MPSRQGEMGEADLNVEELPVKKTTPRKKTTKKKVEPLPEPEPEELKEEEEDFYDEDDEYDSYKMDPKEEVWDGGPTFGQINEWKDRFGDVYVTSVTPKDHIVWRTITRFEYRRLIQNTEQALSTGQMTQAVANLDNEESMAELCILYPEYRRSNASGAMAGIASTVSQQIMEASGFSSIEVRQL